MSDGHLAVAATIRLLLFHWVPLWSTLSGVLHEFRRCNMGLVRR